MEQDNDLDPIEPRDVPVESQDGDDWAEPAVPAEPGASRKSIHSRGELKYRGAVVILSRWRQGLPVTLSDVVDGCGYLVDYRVRNGLCKGMGDALGGNSHGFQLRKTGETFDMDRNNVKLMFQCEEDQNGLPEHEHEEVAIESGFESMAALKVWSRNLPKFVR